MVVAKVPVWQNCHLQNAIFLFSSFLNSHWLYHQSYIVVAQTFIVRCRHPSSYRLSLSVIYWTHFTRNNKANWRQFFCRKAIYSTYPIHFFHNFCFGTLNFPFHLVPMGVNISKWYMHSSHSSQTSVKELLWNVPCRYFHKHICSFFSSALCYCTAELLSSRGRPSSVVRRRPSVRRPSVDSFFSDTAEWIIKAKFLGQVPIHHISRPFFFKI